MQEVSGEYTSPFLDADDLKMALRARKQPGLRGRGEGRGKVLLSKTN